MIPQIEAGDDPLQMYEEIQEKLLKVIEDENQRVNLKM